ncbi:MAG: 2OG-Fe(II) oxygenase [Pseudomonadota bacterium]
MIRARYPNAETLGIMVRNRIDAGSTQTPQSPPATPSTASSLDWEEITSVLAAPSPQINDKDQRKVVGENDGPTASGFNAMVIEKLMPPEVCEHLIAVSAQLLMASKVFDPTTGTVREDPYRNSATAVIGPSDLDYGAAFIGYLIAKAANKDYDTAEFLSVLRYAPGQEYKPHFDWLPEGDELRQSGQRATTALLYLVDDYEGGETAFTEVGATVRGRVGDLLIFENLDTEGEPNMVSRHASLPVTKGVKWIASQWYRERTFAF